MPSPQLTSERDVRGVWPRADKPGFPVNAEREGWHWLCMSFGTLLVGHWVPTLAGWKVDCTDLVVEAHDMISYSYIGEIQLPAGTVVDGGWGPTVAPPAGIIRPATLEAPRRLRP